MSTTEVGGGPAGVHEANVERWFAEHVADAQPPFAYELIAGGHSNLTYKLTDASGQRFVLRRPPLAHVLATAHDMTREFRAIHALGPTPVPVPPALGLCTDQDVIGASFYVMGYVEGHVLHTVEVAQAHYTPETRRVAGESIIDVLADLHAVDIDAVGLGEHGPRDGYVSRQLNRWYKQYTAMEHKDTPAVHEAHAILAGSVPTQQRTTVAHGDFRLGNCLTSFDGPIAAVLDWEISTLGDPLADLAYLLNTWARPDNALGAVDPRLPTMSEGFPSAAELVDRYAARSPLDLSQLSWYVAFNHWKSACIVQGVLSRYLGGALGNVDELPPHVDLQAFARSVEVRSAMAVDALRHRH